MGARREVKVLAGLAGRRVLPLRCDRNKFEGRLGSLVLDLSFGYLPDIHVEMSRRQLDI